MSFVIYSSKTRKCWNQNVFINLQNFVKFDFNPLICVLTLFPGKNIPSTAKSNRVFPGKGIRDRALILTRFDSPMAEVPPHYGLSFSISVIFKGKHGWSKLDQKCKLWVRLFFMKTWILQVFFKRCFCLL